MVKVIEIYLDLAHDDLGRSALDKRVMSAMGRVPLTVVEKDAAGRAHLRELMPVQFGLLETVR
jgi:hypothetical protein